MTSLGQLLPDPAPPPGARERVRAGITGRVARWHRRRIAVVFAGVAAAAACAVAIAARLHSREAPVAVMAGARLSPGVLELGARARVLVADGADVWLLRDDASGTAIRLGRGTIVVNVRPRPAAQPFVIEARDVRVEVVGTRFAVGVAADGTVGVRGDEGAVQVVHPGGRTRVGAGEVWPSESAAPLIDDAARAQVAFAQLAVAPVAPVPPSEPVPVQVSKVSPPRRSPRPAPRVEVIEPPAAAPEPTPYVLARQLEDAGDLSRALAAYRAIRSGPEAEDALYATGRLLLGPIGHPDAAHQTFVAYRRRYPDGRYARAVDLHIFDHALTRDHALAIREADRFLADHSDDPLAPRFREARARLQQRARP
jgi:hypothetical protein